jgi:two-component system nitrate/nitrite response regulator NarL
MRSSDDSAKQITIVVADDHPIFRDGLIRLIETRRDLKVVGTASDGREALELVARLNPDLLLLDLAMPGMSGLLAMRELKEKQTRSHILLLTAAIEQDEIATALQLGARGVVLKETASDVLFHSIEAIMAGQHWVGRTTVDPGTMLRQLASASRTPSRKNFGLTRRELEIIGVILGGYSNADIARQFAISEKTVKHHLTNIFDKIGVSNRLELALFALHHGLEAPLPARPPQVAAGAEDPGTR